MCWLILQYPQTGRTSGNCPTLVIPTSWSRSCSTLRRVEPHATQQEAAWTYRVNRLAVPSDGSNLRQHLATPRQYGCSPSCSTLRRVEPNATPVRPGTNDQKAALAVPSDGSNLMQPEASNRKPTRLSTCSTLRRVEPHATQTQILPSLKQLSCSTLRRVA